MKFLLAKLSLVSIVLGSAFSLLSAHAIGVTVSLSPSSSSSSGAPGITETVSWVRSTATTYVTGTTITIVVDPAIQNVSSTSAIDLDLNGSTDATFTSSSTASNLTTITFTMVTTTESTTTASVPLTNFTFSSLAQNYAVSVYTSSPFDFGAALFYANGGNQVTVTATVPATLSFRIRNSADTADTNSCSLGTLSTSATSTCSYRLRIATNAASGFTSTIQGNQDFGTGSATMTTYTEDGSAAAGTEGYGLSVITGATQGGRTVAGDYTGAVTENGNFSDDASPVPTTSASTFISYSNAFITGPTSTATTTATTLVTHFANITGGTPAGSYSQVVTYTVTATF